GPSSLHRRSSTTCRRTMRLIANTILSVELTQMGDAEKSVKDEADSRRGRPSPEPDATEWRLAATRPAIEEHQNSGAVRQVRMVISASLRRPTPKGGILKIAIPSRAIARATSIGRCF